MREILLKEINYEREWKKTFICKITFGKARPSKSWIEQLKRIQDRKIKKINNLL